MGRWIIAASLGFLIGVVFLVAHPSTLDDIRQSFPTLVQKTQVVAKGQGGSSTKAPEKSSDKVQQRNCRVKILMTELDSARKQIRAGLNGSQASWYEKHRRDYPGMCILFYSPGGQVVIHNLRQRLAENSTGAKLYWVVWGEDGSIDGPISSASGRVDRIHPGGTPDTLPSAEINVGDGGGMYPPSVVFLRQLLERLNDLQVPGHNPFGN